MEKIVKKKFCENTLEHSAQFGPLVNIVPDASIREQRFFLCDSAFQGHPCRRKHTSEIVQADNFSEGPTSLYNQFHNLFKLIEILMPSFAQFLREKDATSMSFCFKWFLIIFKREFSYDDIKILWEALFSGVAPKNFHLLIALAIFDAEADTIMRTCQDMSHILQYINNLSEKINLNNILSRAQGIFNQLFEVRDRLPNEVAAFLGFTPSPSPSGPPGTSRSYSFGDGHHRSSVDEEGLLTTCDFALESALPLSVSPADNNNHISTSAVEVGEDATNCILDVHTTTESSEDPY
ncbi:hypothetical protein ACTXT7_006081 [Hymenolepis weldensis]